jgi:hypothetical protein
MTDERIELDDRRDVAAQKATELRRLRVQVHADQEALRTRQDALERMLAAVPVEGCPDAVEKARYLLGLFADTSEARDPRRGWLITELLADVKRLPGEPADPADDKETDSRSPIDLATEPSRESGHA